MARTETPPAVDPTSGSLRGTNQSGVRAHNERLVLSMLRRDGALSKAELARMTGLSAQTVSVIMRELENDEMLLRDAPRRGRVGQPSVPMRLNPDSAYFHGVTVGRRWVDHVVTDMTGAVRYHEREIHEWPDFDSALDFCRRSFEQANENATDAQLERVEGYGLAMPFKLWDWAYDMGIEQEKLLPWRDRDFAEELSEIVNFDVSCQNDATAACNAELVFGTATDLPDLFLHLFIGYFIGGGLVIDRHLFTGPSGNAAAIGSMPIAQPDGTTRQLLDLASLHSFSAAVRNAGKERDLWTVPVEWTGVEEEVDAWIKQVAPALAQAIATAMSLLDFPAVVIDGHLPDLVRTRLVEAVQNAMEETNFSGLERPELREGTVGPNGRTLGAAALPLAMKFLV